MSRDRLHGIRKKKEKVVDEVAGYDEYMRGENPSILRGIFINNYQNRLQIWMIMIRSAVHSVSLTMRDPIRPCIHVITSKLYLA